MKMNFNRKIALLCLGAFVVIYAVDANYDISYKWLELMWYSLIGYVSIVLWEIMRCIDELKKSD